LKDSFCPIRNFCSAKLTCWDYAKYKSNNGKKENLTMIVVAITATKLLLQLLDLYLGVDSI
jgi:hypothetical protein